MSNPGQIKHKIKKKKKKSKVLKRISLKLQGFIL